jgi:hypothetical protein
MADRRKGRLPEGQGQIFQPTVMKVWRLHLEKGRLINWSDAEIEDILYNEKILCLVSLSIKPG